MAVSNLLKVQQNKEGHCEGEQREGVANVENVRRVDVLF